MPVYPHHVPLSTAKSWAKRLHQFSKNNTSVEKLSHAQKAVAEMLGFKDWHHLNNMLGQPSSSLPLKKVFHHEDPHIDLPKSNASDTEWRKFFSSFAQEDCYIHIEHRKQGWRLRVKRWGVYVGGTQWLPHERLIKGLLAVTRPHVHANLQNQQYLDYVSGSLNLSEHVEGRYQFLPVYPGGCDIVLHVQKINLTPKSLEDIVDIPWILQIMEQSLGHQEGVLMIVGTSGAHTSVLAQALSMRYQELHAKPMIYGPSISKGKLRDHDTTKQIFDASVSNMCVATVNSSSARHVRDRLEDFGLTQEELDRVKVSMYTRRLPKLCPHCSVSGSGLYKVRGEGCDRCDHLGVVGTCSAVSVWAHEKNHTHCVVNIHEHTKLLAERGLVSMEDVEETFGPIQYRQMSL